jgi:hypothetical protein
MTDDGFLELAPQTKVTAKAAGPVVMRTAQIRTRRRVSFSFARDVLAKVQGEGWPRFSVAYNPALGLFRIAGKVQGPFEVAKSPKGERWILRIPMPDGLVVHADAFTPVIRYEGGALMVAVPNALKVPKPDPGKTMAEAAAQISAQKRREDVARKAIPAPKF